MANKTCRICRKTLSTAAFNGSARSADGLADTCRACTNARRRQLEAARTDRRPPADNLAALLRHGDIKNLRARFREGLKTHWSWVCETMREGHLDLAEVLLESGVEQNVFTMAAMGESARLTRRLRRVPAGARLVADFEPSCLSVTPLHVGCASDWRSHGQDRLIVQTRIAEILCEHGADLNATACYRGLESTPLFCACWSSDNLLLVRWLLDHGAIATDHCLPAALGHFQRHGRGADDVAETLLAWGLPVDGGIPGDRTPLQACALQGIHKSVAWLIAHGANVKARGPGGRMAAHLAAERNTGPKTLALLVENGADLAARDDDGHTPLDIAKLNGKRRLVEWIKNHVRSKRR